MEVAFQQIDRTCVLVIKIYRFEVLESCLVVLMKMQISSIKDKYGKY